MLFTFVDLLLPEYIMTIIANVNILTNGLFLRKQIRMLVTKSVMTVVTWSTIVLRSRWHFYQI